MSSELYDAINLGDLINYKKGIAFKSKDYSDNGIPLIRVSNFHEDTLSPNDLKFLPKKIAEENKSVELKFSDIVVATVGSWPNNPSSVVGRVISVPKWSAGALMNQNSVILRVKDSDFYNQRYLFYFLRTKDFSNHIISKAQGSANQASITLDAIFSFPIFWSDYSHRQSVASFLTNIDDRITLLRETNTTLEAIAQALFKSWFVDFDPVHAKQQGRAPEGMDAQTAALFPDSFEESELGMVPKGWSPVRLDSFVELAYGKALKAEARIAGDVPVYGSGGITGWHNAALVNQPSIIVGRKGTVGSLYWENRPFFPIDTVFYVKTEKPLTYVFQVLKSLGLSDMNTDAAVPGLNRENAYRLLVAGASEEVIKAFDSIASDLRMSVAQNLRQIETLESTRDTLLPRLISGQLRLPEAQALVEDAVDA